MNEGKPPIPSKYLRYIRIVNQMVKQHMELKAMQGDVMKELRQLGYTQDVIARMMSLSKGRVNQFCQNVLRERYPRRPKEG